MGAEDCALTCDGETCDNQVCQGNSTCASTCSVASDLQSMSKPRFTSPNSSPQAPAISS